MEKHTQNLLRKSGWSIAEKLENRYKDPKLWMSAGIWLFENVKPEQRDDALNFVEKDLGSSIDQTIEEIVSNEEYFGNPV